MIFLKILQVVTVQISINTLQDLQYQVNDQYVVSQAPFYQASSEHRNPQINTNVLQDYQYETNNSYTASQTQFQQPSSNYQNPQISINAQEYQNPQLLIQINTNASQDNQHHINNQHITLEMQFHQPSYQSEYQNSQLSAQISGDALHVQGRQYPANSTNVSSQTQLHQPLALGQLSSQQRIAPQFLENILMDTSISEHANTPKEIETIIDNQTASQN